MVPFGNAFHEAYALTLGGIGDNQVGFLVGIVDGVEGLDDIIHRVPVHLDHVPSEGTPTLTDIVDGHHVLRVTADLQVVTVDDGNEVVELVLPTSHRSFVDRALALLTIAHQDIGTVGGGRCGRCGREVGVTIHLLCDRHTDTDAESVS